MKNHKNLRMCIACREHKQAFEMFRIVKVDGIACVDETYKAQTRGAYVCKDISCIDKAEKSNAVKRHLKCSDVSNVFERLREMLES